MNISFRSKDSYDNTYDVTIEDFSIGTVSIHGNRCVFEPNGQYINSSVMREILDFMDKTEAINILIEEYPYNNQSVDHTNIIEWAIKHYKMVPTKILGHDHRFSG